MSKNIVLCCDGTANEFAKDHTNVVKLYSVLDHDPARQRTYYHPGLGTMEAAGALTPLARRITKLLGMAVGYGLSADIRDAYVFLMNTYEAGDKVFLFGFSRGAYTVRAVASLLKMYGLIRPANEALVPYAIRMMMAIKRADENRDRAEYKRYFALADDFRDKMSRGDCKPWFVGVWDTVSSVGWIENPLKLPYVTNNPDIQIGRHAIAIDEHRAFFRTHLWRRPEDHGKDWGPKDVKQVWFAGFHCDVGGGHPPQDSGLSKIPLKWMLDEAKGKGLIVDPVKETALLEQSPRLPYPPGDPNWKTHESLTKKWVLAELVPKKHYDRATGITERRMNLFRRRTIEPGSLIHPSVYERGDDYACRLPEGVAPLKD